MMRLTTPQQLRFSQADTLEMNFAGGEANVAASLAVLKMKACHVTRVPENPLGNAVIENLNKVGVDTTFIQRGGERLGVFFVENGISIRAGKVVYDRANSSFASLLPEEFNWHQIFQGCSWFHITGISPAISQNAATACLQAVKVADELGIYVSADVGYRSNLWKWGKTPSEVMPSLVEHCSLIVCSIGDAADMFGVYPRNEEDSFASVSQQLMSRFPSLQLILTTERGQLSASHNTLLAKCWNGAELLVTELIDIPSIVDRIGGGDAFMAGFIYGKLTYGCDYQALRFAVAASALKHTIKGDFNLASVSEIETIMKGDTSGKLTR